MSLNRAVLKGLNFTIKLVSNTCSSRIPIIDDNKNVILVHIIKAIQMKIYYGCPDHHL